MGGKALRIDLVCQWFILNGISKTFCFGFIFACCCCYFFLLLSFYTCELAWARSVFPITFFRFFFVSIYYFEVVVTKTRHCLVDPSALMLHCAGWYPEFADTCTLSSHMSTRFTQKKNHHHHTFTICTFWLWFISPFFLFLPLLCYNFSGCERVKLTILLLLLQILLLLSFKYIYLLFLHSFFIVVSFHCFTAFLFLELILSRRMCSYVVRLLCRRSRRLWALS